MNFQEPEVQIETHDQAIRYKYVCPFCKKDFKYKHTMERHIFIHTGEKPFACTECEYTTNRKDRLASHIGSMHHL